MADLASSVKAMDGAGTLTRLTRPEKIGRHENFKHIPTIFLPRVLHRDLKTREQYRPLDYDRDILGHLDWESFRFLQADTVGINSDEKRERNIARIDLDRSDKESGKALINVSQEEIADIPAEGLDIAFLVRQLLDIILNPWQGMRILAETLETLRARGISEERLYANRLDLLKAMKLDLRQQVNEAAEALFLQKMTSGDIALRLVTSKNAQLNWALAETLEIDVSDNDHILRRKDGDLLHKNLFEKVYQRDFNTLEKETAWYLDSRECVYWWHRIAVNRQSYNLQGWQRQRVYPDLLACLYGTEKGKFRFSVLETKGRHLKGNDDTEYKRKLFELLTSYTENAIRAGEIELGGETQDITFTMLLEDTWKDELLQSGVV